MDPTGIRRAPEQAKELNSNDEEQQRVDGGELEQEREARDQGANVGVGEDLEELLRERAGHEVGGPVGEVAHEADDGVADADEYVADGDVAQVVLGLLGVLHHGQDERVHKVRDRQHAGEDEEVGLELRNVRPREVLEEDAVDDEEADRVKDRDDAERVELDQQAEALEVGDREDEEEDERRGPVAVPPRDPRRRGRRADDGEDRRHERVEYARHENVVGERRAHEQQHAGGPAHVFAREAEVALAHVEEVVGAAAVHEYQQTRVAAHDAEQEDDREPGREAALREAPR